MKSKDCKTCHGTGDCQECEGSGACLECNGEGHDGWGHSCDSCEEGECPLCEGMGECEDCDGTGKDQMDKARIAAIRRTWGRTKAADDLIHNEITIAGLRELQARYKALSLMGPSWDQRKKMWFVDRFKALEPGACNHLILRVGSIDALLDPEAIAAEFDERV